MNTKSKLVILACLLLPALQAGAEVVDIQPWGFMTRNTVTVSVAPDKAFNSLVSGVGKWWDPEHTYSGVSKNLSIDARPGGCFCERIPDKGWIEHMRVVYVSRPDTLRLSGALGPLQSSGNAGSLTWSVAVVEGKTTIQQTYSVGGYQQGGFYELASLVDWVMATQLSRLQRYLDTGDPALPAPAK